MSDRCRRARKCQSRQFTFGVGCVVGVVLASSWSSNEFVRGFTNNADSIDHRPPARGRQQQQQNPQVKRRRPKVRYQWEIPQAASPEIIFVGQSNAGKSTLINGILQHFGSPFHAQTSSIEGKTRSLNWFPVGFASCPEFHHIKWTPQGNIVWPHVSGAAEEDEGDKKLLGPEARGSGMCLVDCFGLGLVRYKDVKLKRMATWAPLLLKYLGERRAVAGVVHVVSSEYRGQLQAGDAELRDLFHRAATMRRASGLPALDHHIVLTKCDMQAPAELPGIVSELTAEIGREQGAAARGQEEQAAPKILQCGGLGEANANSEGVDTADMGLRTVIHALEMATENGWNRYEEWKEEMIQPRDGLMERLGRSRSSSPSAAKRSRREQRAERRRHRQALEGTNAGRKTTGKLRAETI